MINIICILGYFKKTTKYNINNYVYINTNYTIISGVLMKLITREQYYATRKTANKDGLCEFCNKEQIILHETNYWLWIAGLAPYWKYHTMLLPKRHIVEIHEINNKEWGELKSLEKSIIRLYKSSEIINQKNNLPLENVLVFFRQRLNLHNPVLNSRNLDHLHIHFTFDLDHFLDPISHSDAHEWDIEIFKNKLVV